MKVIPIAQAEAIVGGLTQTTKMPCPSFSLPTAACRTGARMAKVAGSVCSTCYASKGRYAAFARTIEPGQVARLGEVLEACRDPDQGDLWVQAMVTLVDRHTYFRWHDSGDLQAIGHLDLIVRVAQATPGTQHWLPTREVGMVKAWIAAGGVLPPNLMVRLSAMYPDSPVVIPKSLRDHPQITVSLVHAKKPPAARACPAPQQEGACGRCRTCWTAEPVSYELH